MSARYPLRGRDVAADIPCNKRIDAICMLAITGLVAGLAAICLAWNWGCL